MTVREMFRRGLFNACHQAHQPDGTVLITLTRRGDPRRYLMLVRNLYRPDEQVLWERVEDLSVRPEPVEGSGRGGA